MVYLVDKAGQTMAFHVNNMRPYSHEMDPGDDLVPRESPDLPPSTPSLGGQNNDLLSPTKGDPPLAAKPISDLVLPRQFPIAPNSAGPSALAPPPPPPQPPRPLPSPALSAPVQIPHSQSVTTTQSRVIKKATRSSQRLNPTNKRHRASDSSSISNANKKKAPRVYTSGQSDQSDISSL